MIADFFLARPSKTRVFEFLARGGARLTTLGTFIPGIEPGHSAA